MTTPDFTFDIKTGELSRGGKVMALKARHTYLFAALGEHFITTRTLSLKSGLPYNVVGVEIAGLRQRIAKLGIAIISKRGSGYCRTIQAMPAKWTPDISAPVTVDDVRQQSKLGEPWTDDQAHRAFELHEQGYGFDEIGRMIGRPESSVRAKVMTEQYRRRTAEGVGPGRLTRDQIAERDLRREGYDARDTTSAFCGDPPRGFSALDKRRGSP